MTTRSTLNFVKLTVMSFHKVFVKSFIEVNLTKCVQIDIPFFTVYERADHVTEWSLWKGIGKASCRAGHVEMKKEMGIMLNRTEQQAAAEQLSRTLSNRFNSAPCSGPSRADCDVIPIGPSPSWSRSEGMHVSNRARSAQHGEIVFLARSPRHLLACCLPGAQSHCSTCFEGA